MLRRPGQISRGVWNIILRQFMLDRIPPRWTLALCPPRRCAFVVVSQDIDVTSASSRTRSARHVARQATAPGCVKMIVDQKFEENEFVDIDIVIVMMVRLRALVLNEFVEAVSEMTVQLRVQVTVRILDIGRATVRAETSTTSPCRLTRLSRRPQISRRSGAWRCPTTSIS